MLRHKLTFNQSTESDKLGATIQLLRSISHEPSQQIIMRKFLFRYFYSDNEYFEPNHSQKTKSYELLHSLIYYSIFIFIFLQFLFGFFALVTEFYCMYLQSVAVAVAVAVAMMLLCFTKKNKNTSLITNYYFWLWMSMSANAHFFLYFDFVCYSIAIVLRFRFRLSFWRNDLFSGNV